MPNSNKTVLLVENEALIAMDLEEMLASAGFGPVSHVTSTGDALAWLSDRRCDIAVLDLMVRDGSTGSVAEMLRCSNVPFLVYSGHARHDIDAGSAFDDAVWLSKPCTQTELERAIGQATRGASAT